MNRDRKRTEVSIMMSPSLCAGPSLSLREEERKAEEGEGRVVQKFLTVNEVIVQ